MDFFDWKKEALNSLIIDGFKVPVEYEAKDPSVFDIVHSEKFVLVDGEGWIKAIIQQIV